MIESTIECIVVNKISGSKESDICHCWYLLDKGFKFQPYVCNRYHDLLMMPINLNSITVLNINGTDVMPCHCSPGDLYQVLRIWDFFFTIGDFLSYTLTLLMELVKVTLQIYCKILIWPKREEYYKN